MLLTCKTCKNEIEVPATEAQIIAWQNGKLIQDAMPNVPAELRELFLSHICPTCWKKIFSEDEE